jgi:ubiquitin-like domain-containing CTD phosphatase 1
MDDSILQYYNFEDNMFMSGNRNFVKSPQNGLAIKPFEKAHLNHAATDPRTIGAVTISVQDNLSNLDH